MVFKTYRWPVLFLLVSSSLGVAHEASALPDSSIARPAQQFGWPFAGNPGPNTWMLGQGYGNTTGAFNRRRSDYGAGQGIHFGVDISARCGTPVLAIADGRVTEVDGPHGSAPHNLTLLHAGNLSSLYGHLLERSSLKVGQRVGRGQMVGKSGDSQFTCTSAPHLHLEIRDASHRRFFNPVLYIKADWDTLSLVGGFGRGFARDLEQPRRWQNLQDQPQARRGGALLNNYSNPWPPPPGSSVTLPPVGSYKLPFVQGTEALENPPPAPRIRGIQKLTSDGCCANPAFLPGAQSVYFLDKPSAKSKTGFYSVNVFAPKTPSYLGPLGFLSSDATKVSWPRETSSTVEVLATRERFSLPTKGANPIWSPSGKLAAWTVSSQSGNFDGRKLEVYVSGQDGKARKIATRYGGGFAGWLDEETVLLSGKRAAKDALRVLESLNFRTGGTKTLTKAQNFRSLSVAPGGKYMVYTVAFDIKERNGLFLASTAGGTPRALSTFGSVRWRNSDRLLMIPLDLNVKSHRVLELDAETGKSRELVNLGHKVTLDDWSVSGQGEHMVFRSGGDLNVYALELPE
ncbi:MAG: M23 family metallopeptidase [Pseudopedobacter sp.]|nr:M23 family metallopeptidase [Deinococcales bacterium]